MNAATITTALTLATTIIDGIVQLAEASGATPEELLDLRKKIAEKTLSTRARFDAAQNAADERIRNG